MGGGTPLPFSCMGSSYRLVPQEELESRVFRLSHILRDLSIDAAVFPYRVHSYYFTGSAQSMVTVITKSGDVIIFVRRVIERVREESPWKDVRKLASSDDIFRFLRGFSRVGIPLSRMDASTYVKYASKLGGNLVDISDEMESLLSVKSPFEVSCLEKAASIAEKVFNEAPNFVKPGMTEIEVAGIFDMLGKKFGSESYLRTGSINYEAYTWHVVSGSNAFFRSYIETVVGGRGLSPSFPCGAGLKKIEEGEPFLVDFGVSYMGYMVDHARTFVFGEPSYEVFDLYDRLLTLVGRVEELMVPGTICSEIYTRSLELSEELGVKDFYLGGPSWDVNFIAHGVGLEFSGKPIMGRGQDYALAEGMTFAMELKLIVPEVGPLGLEDVYVARKKGSSRITKTADSMFLL